jgi:deoxycytidylate deaminase
MISNRAIKYFNIAKSVSKLSDFYKCHTGCVVVYHKQIISVGVNQNKTHPIQKYYNQYRFDNSIGTHNIHAEIDALSKIKYYDIDWSKVDLYVYREHKATGKLMLFKPCPSCMAYIKNLGIKNIYYTDYGSYNFMKMVG